MALREFADRTVDLRAYLCFVMQDLVYLESL